MNRLNFTLLLFLMSIVAFAQSSKGRLFPKTKSLSAYYQQLYKHKDTGRTALTIQFL